MKGREDHEKSKNNDEEETKSDIEEALSKLLRSDSP